MDGLTAAPSFAAIASGGPSGDVAPFVSQWWEAQRRLYPIVLAEPDLYERAILLVRAVADQLDDVPSIDALAGLASQAVDLVRLMAGRMGMPPDELDTVGLRTIAGAALLLRYAELIGLAPRRRVA